MGGPPARALGETSRLTVGQVQHGGRWNPRPGAFRRLGITLDTHGDDLVIPANDHYEIESYLDGSIMTIADAPSPAGVVDAELPLVTTVRADADTDPDSYAGADAEHGDASGGKPLHRLFAED